MLVSSRSVSNSLSEMTSRGSYFQGVPFYMRINNSLFAGTMHHPSPISFSRLLSQSNRPSRGACSLTDASSAFASRNHIAHSSCHWFPPRRSGGTKQDRGNLDNWPFDVYFRVVQKLRVFQKGLLLPLKSEPKESSTQKQKSNEFNPNFQHFLFYLKKRILYKVGRDFYETLSSVGTFHPSLLTQWLFMNSF